MDLRSPQRDYKTSPPVASPDRSNNPDDSTNAMHAHSPPSKHATQLHTQPGKQSFGDRFGALVVLGHIT